MKRIFFLILGLVVAGLTATAFAVEGPSGESQVLLLQKHLGKGVVCTGCHQETPPATSVKTTKCLSCHGTYDQLADKTEGKAAQNPHASHNGELSCDSCHNVHKPSVNYCSQCHQFEFKVP
jgi:hypothetical protein